MAIKNNTNKLNELIDTINALPEYEPGIDTSDATATERDIRKGETAYVNGQKITGKLKAVDNLTFFGDGGTFNSSTGYIEQQWLNDVAAYILEENALITTHTEASTFGNATEADVLVGKTFTSENGLQIEGAMPIKDEQTYTPGTSAQTISSGTYLIGNQTIEGDSNLVEENIKSGSSIFGVNGNYTSDATATRNDMAQGTTAYVNGNKVTGSLYVAEADSKIASEFDILAHRGSTVSFYGTPLTSDMVVRTGAISVINVPYTKFGNATTEDVISGKTFTSESGIKVAGSIPTKDEQTYTPGTSAQTIPSGQYLTGTQTIEGDINLVTDNIKSGTSIFGVSGSYTSDATATSDDITDGSTAYVNGVKLIGSNPYDKTQTDTTVSTQAELLEQAIAALEGKAIDGGSGGGGSGGSSEEWIGDGNTHIWITLHEGRTSPMLGVCPKGTVTVDWGDGTTPDVLTGTSVSTVKWTPTHNYAEPGDYVITLTVDGEMGFSGASSANQYAYLMRFSNSSDSRNRVYQNAVQKIEIGNSVTSIGNHAFSYCYSLASVVIPDGVTSIGSSAFSNCYSLASIVIPDSVTSIGSSAFYYCYSLASIVIPDGVTSIGGSVFYNCYSLASIVIPDGVTSIGSSAFYYCYSLASIVIPASVTRIGDYAFNNCYSLASIVIPDSVTSIGDSVFYNCYSLASVVIPDGVTSIDARAFYNCYGIRYYDFTKHTAVPTLANANAFNKIPADCEIRVPAALHDEWIAATNWATYASQIVAV